MQCTVDKCEREARYTFIWPWGEAGACCQEHVIVVQQKAKAARGKYGQVSFTALDPDRPREITRDERVALHTRALVAESETKDAQLRATKFFELNTKLGEELRAARARVAQYEANDKEQRRTIEALVVERDAALVALDKAREEAQRFGVFEEHTPAEVPRPHT